jgi:uncharacterized protein
MADWPPSIRPVALLTAADTPLGAALAEELARRGFDLLLTGEEGDALFELLQTCRRAHGAQATLLQGDLSRAPLRADLARLIADLELKIDLLVHAAAGLAGPGTPTGKQLELATRTSLELVDLVRPGFLREDNGYLLLVSGEAGLRPEGEHPAESAALHWLVGYGLSLAAAWKGSGCSATVVCPAPGDDPRQVARRALRGLFARRALVAPRGRGRLSAALRGSLPG